LWLLEGKRITETLGMVRGSTIRARHVGRDIMAGLRNIVGGEVKDYTVMLAQAREEAMQRMIEQAEKMGANAIISRPTCLALIVLPLAIPRVSVILLPSICSVVTTITFPPP